MKEERCACMYYVYVCKPICVYLCGSSIRLAQHSFLSTLSLQEFRMLFICGQQSSGPSTDDKESAHIIFVYLNSFQGFKVAITIARVV